MSEIFAELTATERDLILSSWEEIQEKADATDYFKFLYIIDEQTMKPLFQDVISGGAMVFTMFNICTRLVQSDPDAEDDLYELADRHREYGAKEEHFATIRGAFINTIKGVFKDKDTTELEVAWIKVWDEVSKVIADALAEE